ncbi:MAG: NO-inducible flavohemoprotein [Gammaproteobacteria bacterium]
MLSPKTMTIVKATAPILDQHGEALTRHFYKRMFAHNPEVIPFFNPAHQVSGTQQKALAGAICAYAANIDNLGALGGAVELIAQKHASLQIKPEQYPVVGSNLLASIREVLGEGATDEVIDAWAEAYGFLADILIGREAQIYKDQAEANHGWDGFKPFRVVKKEKESEVITSFYLVPEDGEGLRDFNPGQFITVKIPTPCGHTTMRNYSLSDKPGRGYYRISVKREGYVSNKLHDCVDVGATLEVAPPCGEFFLELTTQDTCPLVFFAGGVGITPILSMLYSALDAMPNRKIVLLHACLHEEAQAFTDTLNELAQQHQHFTVYHCYSEDAPKGVTRSSQALNGWVSESVIASLVPDGEADYYFCGPKPFMTSIYRQLVARGVPSTRMHYEFFGPREDLLNRQ